MCTAVDIVVHGDCLHADIEEVVAMRRYRFILGMVASMAGITGIACADGENILLYNRTTGAGMTGHLRGVEIAIEKKYDKGAFAKWTNVVLIDNAHKLLFYNRETGVWVVGQLDKGSFTTSQDARSDLAKGWTNMVGIEPSTPNRTLLIYKSDDGSAVMGFDPTTKRFEPGELLAGWSHIVRTVEGMLFYNSRLGSGAIASRHALPDADPMGTIGGPWELKTDLTYDPGGFAKHWSHVVALDTDILFYNKDTGSGAVGRIKTDANGKRFETLSTLEDGKFSTGWTDVVAIPGSNKILFYQESTGHAAIGEIVDGHFKTLRRFEQKELGSGWTDIVAARSDSTPFIPPR